VHEFITLGDDEITIGAGIPIEEYNLMIKVTDDDLNNPLDGTLSVTVTVVPAPLVNEAPGCVTLTDQIYTLGENRLDIVLYPDLVFDNDDTSFTFEISPDRSNLFTISDFTFIIFADYLNSYFEP